MAAASAGSAARRLCHEIRNLLRAPEPASLAGRAFRAPAAQGRPRAGRARRPRRLRLRLGGRASLPGGVQPFLGPRGVPRGRRGAHREHPPGTRNRADSAGRQPPGARRRAGRDARPDLRRPRGLRHRRVLLGGRAGRLPDRPRAQARDVGGRDGRDRSHVRGGAVCRLGQRVLADAGPQRGPQAAPAPAPAAVGGLQPPRDDPVRSPQRDRRALLLVRRARGRRAGGSRSTTRSSTPTSACRSAST